MLMESEGSTFGIIGLFVCEQQLALTGGRSSSLKHFNAEILAFPITLAEGVFTPGVREGTRGQRGKNHINLQYSVCLLRLHHY